MDVSLLSGLLAERLLAHIPGQEKVFFCNSGTEAVEAAIKLARAATRRSKLVFCDHAFHGLTHGRADDERRRVLPRRLRSVAGRRRARPVERSRRRWRRRWPAATSRRSSSSRSRARASTCPSPGYLRGGGARCARSTARCSSPTRCRPASAAPGSSWPSSTTASIPISCCSPRRCRAASSRWARWSARSGSSTALFDRMDRAVVHGSTFGKNNLAMAAGLATLAVLEDEGLIENAARRGDEPAAAAGRAGRRSTSCSRRCAGAGSWSRSSSARPSRSRCARPGRLLEKATKGLFCQMVIIPLFTRHRILSQVAGHEMYVIKLLAAAVHLAVRRGLDRRGVRRRHRRLPQVAELGLGPGDDAGRARAQEQGRRVRGAAAGLRAPGGPRGRRRRGAASQRSAAGGARAPRAARRRSAPTRASADVDGRDAPGVDRARLDEEASNARASGRWGWGIGIGAGGVASLAAVPFVAATAIASTGTPAPSPRRSASSRSWSRRST